MYSLLSGLRVIEGASFIAAPLCGLTFAELGAEVIRFDQIGGGLDFGRWPVTADGHSLYWEGLNKGKKSIALDLNRPEGRELAVALITAADSRSADGEPVTSGLFVTNYPAAGFLSHDKLAQRRPDLITLRVTGSSDGSSGFDYTVNSAAGYPFLTGPVDSDRPVNHVLPAWDISCGLTAATTLLSAERARSRNGQGGEIRLALSDIAFSTLGNLGQIAEVQVNGAERPKLGNDLYGAFGRDFRTADGRYVMICAITRKQWSALLEAFGLVAEVSALEKALGVDFGADEGQRFEHRATLFGLVEARIRLMTYPQCIALLEQHAVMWGPYRSVRQALAEDPRLSEANPMFQMATHPSGKPYLTPGFPAAISQAVRQRVPVAPTLGQHTDEILAQVLGLTSGAVGALHDKGLVAQS